MSRARVVVTWHLEVRAAEHDGWAEVLVSLDLSVAVFVFLSVLVCHTL